MIEPASGDFVLLSLVVLVASVVQGAVGLGFAFVLIPVLAAVEPNAVPATVITLGLPLTLYVAYRERGAIDLPGLLWLLPGRVVGTGLGVVVLVVVPRHALQIVFGVLMVLGAVLTGLGPSIPMRPGTQVGAGTLSGLMGTTAALGGPALGLLYGGRPSPELRSTLGAILAIGTVLSLAGLAIADRLHADHVVAALWLTPAMALGLGLSGMLARSLPDRVVRAAVLTFAVVAGAWMASRA